MSDSPLDSLFEILIEVLAVCVSFYVSLRLARSACYAFNIIHLVFAVRITLYVDTDAVTDCFLFAVGM